MKGGIIMAIVKATDEAIEGIKDVLKKENITGTKLRIFVQMGWGGESFNLALDEPTEQDTTEEIGGFTFAVDKRLVEKYTSFDIELVKYGQMINFKITPENNKPSGGDCSSCSSCG